MATFKVGYNPTLKSAIIRPSAGTLPTGYQNIGTFVHDEVADPLGSAPTHTVFQHVQYLLDKSAYKQDRGIVTIQNYLASGSVPAPVFSTPAAVEADDQGGRVRYLARQGKASDALKYTRRWLLNGSAMGAAQAFYPPIDGNLVLEVTATGPGGSTTSTTTAIAVEKYPAIPGRNTPTPTPAPMPTLSPLTLSISVVAPNVSTVININGAMNGSVITLAAPLPAGYTLNSAARTITVNTGSSGTTNFQLIETLPGISNSPRTSNASITVTAASITLGNVAMTGTLTQGTPASSVTLTGLTAGSTVTFNAAGAGLTVNGSGTTRTVTGTPTASGQLNVTETLAGATNSPRTTNNIKNVVAISLPALPAGYSSEWIMAKGTVCPMQYGSAGYAAVYYNNKLYFAVQAENRRYSRKEFLVCSFDRFASGDQWSPWVTALINDAANTPSMSGATGPSSGKDGDHGAPAITFTKGGRMVIGGFWHSSHRIQWAVCSIPNSVGTAIGDWRLQTPGPYGAYTHFQTIDTATNPNTVCLFSRGNGTTAGVLGAINCTKFVFSGANEENVVIDTPQVIATTDGAESGFGARIYIDSTELLPDGKTVVACCCWADQDNTIQRHVFMYTYDVDLNTVRPYGVDAGLADPAPVNSATQLSKSYRLVNTPAPGRLNIPKMYFNKTTGYMYVTYPDQPDIAVNSATSKLLIHDGSAWGSPINFPQGAEVPNHKPIEPMNNGGLRFYCAGATDLGIYYIERATNGTWGTVQTLKLHDDVPADNARDVGYVAIGRVKDGPVWAKRVFWENANAPYGGTWYGPQNRVWVSGDEGLIRYATAIRKGDAMAAKASSDYQSVPIAAPFLSELSTIMQSILNTDTTVIEYFDFGGMNTDGLEANALRGLIAGTVATKRGSPTWTRGRGFTTTAEGQGIIIPINMNALHAAGNILGENWWSFGVWLNNDLPDAAGFDVANGQNIYLNFGETGTLLKTGSTGETVATTGSVVGWNDYNRLGGNQSRHFLARNGKNLAADYLGNVHAHTGFDTNQNIYLGCRATAGAGVTRIGRGYKRFLVGAAKMPPVAARFGRDMVAHDGRMLTLHGLT